MFSVIFDMDGTLLDTQRICIPAWEYAGREQGIAGVGEHIYRVCGMNEPGWTAYLEAHVPGLDLPAFKAEVRAYIAREGDVRFKPGAAALLRFLREHGIRMALASGSSRRTVEHHLALVNATDCFDAIACGQDVARGKPAPDVFLYAARQMGVPPETCFVLEDSDNGIRAGHAAGMQCIGIPDVVPFDASIRSLLAAELTSMEEAIPLFAARLSTEKTG